MIIVSRFVGVDEYGHSMHQFLCCIPYKLYGKAYDNPLDSAPNYIVIACFSTLQDAQDYLNTH